MLTLDRHIGVRFSEPGSLSAQRGAPPERTFPTSRQDPPPVCWEQSTAWVQVQSTIRSAKSTVLHDLGGLRRSPRVCQSLKNLERQACHAGGRGFGTRRSRHRFGKLHNYGPVPPTLNRDGSGFAFLTLDRHIGVRIPGAIPNPRRKPIFSVVGLMYKR
jgi:hypothetical protein